MARRSLEVTHTAPDPSRIPDRLTQPVALLLDLRRRGVIDALGERLHIRRQGGFCGLDVWLALFVYFAAGVSQGIRPFWEWFRQHHKRVAAVAGRRRLPSPASVSRALDSVEFELLRPQMSWLLAGVSGIDDVMRHPAALTYDTRGQGWHIFDVDPTVTTLRHRALPTGEDLPEARRRSDDTAKPGYSGRKRGDVQFRRVTVGHVGSGAWVHGHLSQGNGEGVGDLRLALGSIAETADRLGHPRQWVLVRLDGEYGNVPWFWECRDHELPFLTRLNRPALFTDPEVLARLRTATWELVDDSRSGPQRAAADIGVLTIHADRKTRRADGGTYDPVTVRVVASIYPTSKKATRGRVLDGWQVELFAADLDPDAWPAAEVISTYYARSSLENRFAQEDRELGLDRIASYHLPGQELATLVGLSVWNLRLARGFAHDPPPDKDPVHHLRQPRIDARVPAAWPRDPVLVETLGTLPWDSLLAGWPGWTFEAATGELRCPDGRLLTLTTVRGDERAPGRTAIIFRRPQGGCEQCGARSGCLHTDRPLASKHAEFSIPSNVAEQLRDRLGKVRRPPTSRLAEVQGSPGPRAVVDSLFLPARARRAYNDVFIGAAAWVNVQMPPPETPRPRLLANDVGDRQRRRLTWQQNVERFALPGAATVAVRFEGSPALRDLVGASVAMAGKAGIG